MKMNFFKRLAEKIRQPFKKEAAPPSVPEDMKRWKEELYPKLVETGILLDGKFFNPQGGNFGIGADGYFTGYEFFQFIYRTYKALYEHSKLKG